MSKNDYRLFFDYVKPFIKLSFFCKKVGIANTTLSLFMRGDSYNYAMSIERCQELYNEIASTLNTIS